jgi:Flp pilus assembly protein TadG
MDDARRRPATDRATNHQFCLIWWRMLQGARGLAGRQDGASAIEFAIVAPVFLLVVLGILVYGIYLGSAHSVEQLAADAARASIAGLTDAERIQIATQHVIRNAPDYPLLSADKVSVDAGASPTDPTQFRVSVRFDASELPIWAVADFVPMADRIIERSSVIKRGGY